MKKLILAVAVFMSVGAFTFAQLDQPIPVTGKAATEVAQDTFKEVTEADLNEKVQTALTRFGETFTVKKLEYSESQKQTRVTLEDKSSKAEKVVLLDDEGNEVK